MSVFDRALPRPRQASDELHRAALARIRAAGTSLGRVLAASARPADAPGLEAELNPVRPGPRAPR